MQPHHHHNPYIAYTPSYKTANSSNIPPIPSPNAAHHPHEHITNASSHYINPHHPQWHPHNLSVVSPSEYSSIPPEHVFNRYVQLPTHSLSNPNPSPPEHDTDHARPDTALLDTLLSAPDDHNNDQQHTENISPKKKSSHPLRSYTRREPKTSKVPSPGSNTNINVNTLK